LGLAWLLREGQFGAFAVIEGGRFLHETTYRQG